MPKKSNYTKNKTTQNKFSLKKIILFLIILLFIHITYINVSILFSHNSKTEVLVITSIEKINSARVSIKNQNHFDQNIQLFEKDQMRKILILASENNSWISAVEIIGEYLLENDVWGGNIAQLESYPWSYYKEILGFLNNQKLKNAAILTSFWNYYKTSQKFHANAYDSIVIKTYYNGFADTFFGSFQNFYYFWKNKL